MALLLIRLLAAPELLLAAQAAGCSMLSSGSSLTRAAGARCSAAAARHRAAGCSMLSTGSSPPVLPVLNAQQRQLAAQAAVLDAQLVHWLLLHNACRARRRQCGAVPAAGAQLAPA